MESRYPQKVTLNNGLVVDIRPLEAKESLKLHQFFARLPLEATALQTEDLVAPHVSTRLVTNLDTSEVCCLLALAPEGEVVASATLSFANHGWRRHVGEVDVVVAQQLQSQGLATHLLRELVSLACEKNLQKLEAQVIDTQAGAMQTFNRLGFHEEARLKDHALDHQNRPHDVVILTTPVQNLWQKMENLIMELDINRALEAY